MEYYLLSPLDNPDNNWVLMHSTPKVQARQAYWHLRCIGCGRVDEAAAIAIGLSPDVRITTEYNIVWSSDGFCCMRRKLADALKANGVFGLTFIPFPGDEDFVLAWPQPLVPTDPATCAIVFSNPCPRCGRFKSSLYGVGLWSLTLPPQELAFSARQFGWIPARVVGRS